MGWETPENHVAVKAAVEAYKQTIGECLNEKDIEHLLNATSCFVI